MSNQDEQLIPATMRDKMGPCLKTALVHICRTQPKYGTRLMEQLQGVDELFYSRAEGALQCYESFMLGQGQDLVSGVNCYLSLCTSMTRERVLFLRSGRYRNNSFEEVNRTVYADPTRMRTHMHGLLLAQFLWSEQYQRFAFFCDHLPGYAPGLRRYLEVGGGHALYVKAALEMLGPKVHFDLVDISPSSLELARGMVSSERVHMHLRDIQQLEENAPYDFITMGEVLEHVEDPLRLLKKVRSLLTPQGHAYITTPANAPTIDHIHLFNNEDEIRQMLRDGGLEIERETMMFGDNVPPERGRQEKISLMYAAFLSRRED